MNEKYISDLILKKTKKDLNISNLYENPIFADFYDSTTTKSEFYNDVEFYKTVLESNKKNIELACGSGRVLKSLIDSNINIIGIESEKTMINKVEEKYHKYIFNEDIFNYEKLQQVYKNIDNIIIPATSISLFSKDSLIRLLKTLKHLNPNNKFKIYFDLINLNTILTDRPIKYLNEAGTFYCFNFFTDHKVIYNNFHKESNTIGISFKYDYSYNDLLELFNSLSYSLKIVKQHDNYTMLKGEKL
ncbi:hypothetical protein ACUW92_002396 [Staphylococcus epidermidis]|uniref:class I SAM-dependent methyltransferase n=1 Tax=Staphylococcus epidermidis TaxID=1282 RepID=UPI00138B1512|nr:class I SAM-dependent methyltransferase [Staphylococcus epidermidis]MBM0848342.1 class I SAM-dependent methyltransferase [Staphylococcus epidermidis]MBM6228457.1 hypothetical protein [Staphylococcus epidermidis]MBM6233090.1 hypothetical protein [Staphylococcus epidermidis]MBM6235373.1 hypothetical protein [Staphylococcus epidermidis]MBM6237688.1 hypothetical protein [Staphylococcus epidermidis]